MPQFRQHSGWRTAAQETSDEAYLAVNFSDKFRRLAELWQPRVVAEMNDYQFKVVRLEGDFVWHSHAETDEAFIVPEEELRIDFRDGSVTLKAGEMTVVPKGREHKPFAVRFYPWPR